MEKDNTYRKLEKDFAAIRDERGTQANTANRIGSAFLSLLSYIGSAAFLRKDVPDTAEQVMTFLKGIVAKAVSFFHGIENKGYINNDGDITNTGNISNAGNITTKNLTVTGKATFFELEIQKAKAAGGMSVNSAGSFHIDAVVETADGFVCYQRAEKDGVKLLQTCEPKDQMMCSNGMNSLPLQGRGGPTNDGKPHAIGNHYYWRLATEAPKEVVMHTIEGKEEKCLKLVLSKTDRHKLKNESPQDIGDIPKVGDDLVQVGNRDNKERQSVMMSCAYNSFDPELKPSYWAHYMGVNDYDISKHRYTWFAANGSQVTGNFKVQSDNGGLESIEDYVKGMASNTEVWHVAFSIRNITGKQGETFRLKVVRIVGDKAEEVDGAALSAAGADLLIFGDDMGTELRVNPGVDYFTADYPHKRYLRARVVSSGTDITLAQDTIYTDVEDGKPGKDAVSYKLLPLSEKVLAYISEDKKTKVKTNKVGIRLLYKIMKSAGEQVNFTTLEAEGMTLTIQPSINNSETFNYDYKIDAYSLSASITYKEIPDNSYTVTLKKGRDIVDQRIVPITFKPNVVFDIDTVNGEIRSEIKTVDGKVNSFKATIDETSNTVGKLEKEFTQIRQTAKEVAIEQISKTTGRDNLLVGSAFRNENEIKWYNKADPKLHECRISRTVNCFGTNSVMIESTSTKESYLGVAFYGIKVNAGGKYNLSCQIYKEAGKDTGKVCYEVKCYRKDKSRATVFRPFYNVLSSEDDKWTLNQSDFVVGDDVDYIDVFFWVARAGKFYLACPMLREGEGYTKWSLSQFDYGYVGGNMLDGTKNFNGSHINVNKVSKGSNNGYVTARYSTTVDEYFLSWYYDRGLLKTDTDYVFSFVAKGTGVIGVTIYGGDNKTVLSEGSSGAIIPYDETQYGEQKFRLTDDFRKYWVRIRTSKSFDDATQVGFRTYGGGASIELHSVKLEEGASDTSYTESTEKLVSEDLFMRAGIYLKNGEIRLDAKNTIVSDNLSVGSLKTVPKVAGDPFIEAHDGEFNIFTFERKKGIELSVDDSGMPHLIFYDKDGNPAYDLGWTGMKQLTDAVVQEYWSADFLMKEDSYTDANSISKIMESDCRKFYTYHAAYNRKKGFYGSNEEYNDVTFVENDFSKQRIADGWYYPVNNGSLARVANESAYIYGTRKYQYSNGKMIGYENVYIEKDPVTGAWTFSDYKGGRGSNHSVDQHSQP